MPCGANDFVSVAFASKFISLLTRTAERCAPIVASSRPCSDCCKSDSYFSLATSWSCVCLSALVESATAPASSSADGRKIVPFWSTIVTFSGLRPATAPDTSCVMPRTSCALSCIPTLVWIATDAVVGCCVVEYSEASGAAMCTRADCTGPRPEIVR